MSAADLPSLGYSSSLEMARVLASYMDCPRAIQQRIREDFDRPPTLGTIRRLREEHLNPRRAEEAPFKAHEGHYPADAAERLDKTNARFLEALASERRRSLGFVNPAWRRVA